MCEIDNQYKKYMSQLLEENKYLRLMAETKTTINKSPVCTNKFQPLISKKDKKLMNETIFFDTPNREIKLKDNLYTTTDDNDHKDDIPSKDFNETSTKSKDNGSRNDTNDDPVQIECSSPVESKMMKKLSMFKTAPKLFLLNNKSLVNKNSL